MQKIFVFYHLQIINLQDFVQCGTLNNRLRKYDLLQKGIIHLVRTQTFLEN